jgi:C-terminal processing protease CtpA/Prc
VQGEEGSKVLLTIERDGKEKSVEGTRIKCA